MWDGVSQRQHDDTFVEALLADKDSAWQEEADILNRELAIVQAALEKVDLEESRMIDGYREGVISLDELKRGRTLSRRKRDELQAEQTRIHERKQRAP